MIAPQNSLPGSDSLADEAAEWFVTLASGDATKDDHQRCDEWRRASDSHEAAWQHVAQAMARFAGLPRPVILAASPLFDRAGSALPASRRRKAGQSLLILALVSVLTLATYHLHTRMDWSADAVTAVGEQRRLELADGSHIVLDTDSAIDIHFTDKVREIRVRRGQILVETAPDRGVTTHRDFIVKTRDGIIQALGTRFSVQQQSAATRVAVLEARVVVTPKDIASETRLSAGDALRFDHHGEQHLETVSLQDASWSTGALVVDNMRLGDFVVQLERYRATPLRCKAEACELRISGAFPLLQTDRVLEGLTQSLPVIIRSSAGKGSIIEKR